MVVVTDVAGNSETEATSNELEIANSLWGEQRFPFEQLGCQLMDVFRSEGLELQLLDLAACGQFRHGLQERKQLLFIL